MSSTFTRSSLCHMARRKCHLPSTPAKALSTIPQPSLGSSSRSGGIESVPPLPLLQSQEMNAACVTNFNMSVGMNININMNGNGSKKAVEVHLIKTLENILHVQEALRCLTIEKQEEDSESLAVSSSDSNVNNQNDGEKNGTVQIEDDPEESQGELEKWKKSIISLAFKKGDKKKAKKLFLSTPDNIRQAAVADPMFIRSFGNLLILLKNDHDPEVPFRIFRRMEDMYSVLSGDDEFQSLPQSDRLRLHETRITAIRCVTRIVLEKISDVQIGPYMGMVRTIRDAVRTLPSTNPIQSTNRQEECILIQHEFYSKLMRSLMKYGKTSLYAQRRNSPSLVALEREVWDEALFSFRGNFQRGYLRDYPHVLKHYEKILKMSTFRSQKYLPFPYMLKLVAMAGGRPSPEIVCNIIQNEFPYKNTDTVRDMAKTLRRLQWSNEDNPLAPDYIMDMGTLEHMTCISSRQGRTQITDMMTHYIELAASADVNNEYFKPSIGLYENFAKSFASSRDKRMEVLFHVLAEMEELGYEAGHFFCQQIGESLRTRSRVSKLNKAVHILQNGYDARYQKSRFAYADGSNDGTGQRAYAYGYNSVGDSGGGAYGEEDDQEDIPVRPTTTALNCILSAYADMGLTDAACAAFDKFSSMDLQPNEHSFAFLMKAIAMNLTTALPKHNVTDGVCYGHGSYDEEDHGWISYQVEAADVLIQEASRRNVHHENLNHWYVQVLSAAGLVDRALKFLKDVVHDNGVHEDTNVEAEIDSDLDVEEQARRLPALELKSFSLIALDLARLGELDGVEEVTALAKAAGYKKGLPPHTMKHIERLRGSRVERW